MLSRRNFIRRSSLASSSLWIPSFLRSTSLSYPHLPKSREDKVLVVIQLSGGNDGLNMIVPYRNDIYYRSRPEIGIKPHLVQRLDDEHGFNPAMAPLLDVFNANEVCIMNEVGYPNPDRSHFRSMDIWHTASNSSQRRQTGWLGRYLDSECLSCQDAYHAIEVGDNLSLALHGKIRDGLAMRGPEKLKRATDNSFLQKIGSAYRERSPNHLDFLYKTMIEVQQSAQYLTQKAKTHRSQFDYPNHAFGHGMKQIAELITADTATKIYYISLPGFDTHINQKARHHQLLNLYAETVATFVDDLKSNDLFDNILIMTFSEFGRRVEENASQGTDHGAANNLILIGDKLNTTGFYNRPANLSVLDDGDLRFQVDFRSVYADILDHWLQADANNLLGHQVDRLSPGLFL
ncbi:MAG: DUF1501 domain-containing protein [Saprospiraceae bacterium]|nr:DUF1501 domain-containing protein [Saprospiraceae bacterium]